MCKPDDFEVVTSFSIDGVPYMNSGDLFADEAQFYYVRDMTLAGRTDIVTIVLAHLEKEDKIRKAIRSPYVDFCTDGVVYKHTETGELFGHPKAAGGFTRCFGLWVRDRGTVDVKTAFFKSSTMAAKTLGLHGKGTFSLGGMRTLLFSIRLRFKTRWNTTSRHS